MGEAIFQIAIDGPSGAGKSTIAKMVAKELDIDYIDTGAMYRAMGLKMLRHSIPMEEGPELLSMLSNTEIDFSKGHVYLDGEDVSSLIRTSQISKAASDCSAFASVRKKLVELQKAMGAKKSVIMDGRDIGTVVLKESEFKYFLTASDVVRAQRRYKELMEKGSNESFEAVLKDLRQRDYNDTNRAVTPLRKAEDAIEIDSTNMTIEEVCRFICDQVKGKYGK